MTDREVMQMALDVMLAAIKAGDWKVDGACDPDYVFEALRARLAQGEQDTECPYCAGSGCVACDARCLPQGEQEPVVWVDVKDYESQYEVSSNGDIRNKKTGTVLSKSLMGAGYVKADLWKDGVRWQTSVHRIVASAFVDNPDMLDEVNHINGNKTDNRAVNLEWVSRADNVNHSYYELGNQVKPVIATHIERGEKFHYPSISAAERDGFSSAHIINVINGKRKQHKGFTFSYADTAPPQHEWQRLTDEEINTIAATPAAIPGSYVYSFARAIEAKLNEKNTK